MSTIWINRSDSRCGACGHGADPSEMAHFTILEYGPQNGKPGCGVKWTHVSSGYTDILKHLINRDFSGMYMYPVYDLPVEGV